MKVSFSRLAAICAFTAAAASGCRVRDVRNATIATTGIETDADLAAVTAALKELPDSRLTNRRQDKRTCFEVVAFDKASGALTVRYDSMKIGTKNIEEAIANAGFGTPTFPAKPRKGAQSHGRGE